MAIYEDQKNHIQLAYKHFSKTAVNVFNNEGFTTSAMFAMGEPEEGKPIGRIVALRSDVASQMHASIEGQDALASLVRALLDPASKTTQDFFQSNGFRPYMVAQVNEAQATIRAKNGSKNDSGEISGEDIALKQEVIVINVHSQLGTYIGMHSIVDEPLRHAVLSTSPPFPVTTGRMTVSPANETPELADVLKKIMN